MNKNTNTLDFYTYQKVKNEIDPNIKTNSLRKKTVDEDIIKIPRKSKKVSECNSNKRYLTPLSSRYQADSFDNNKNFSRVSTDLNQNSNLNQYIYQGNNKSGKDNDASYYKNLYIQTKNNLNKEKQKIEENHRNLINFSNENNILKEKINNLTTQLDRLINLVELSNNQKLKKQDEIKKLNSQIDSLKKNNNIIKLKNNQEKENLANTIEQLNSDNRNTHITIKNYKNQLEKMNQESFKEINKLKEQIVSLNKNLTLSINEKNKNDQKNKEIIDKLNKQLIESLENGKKYEMKNIENKRILNELNEYKKNFN